MLLHTWAPACLRAAGLTVVETSGWTGRSHGAFPDSISAAWHHDASPPGDSPGALNWMIDNWANASANFWVNRPGVWYCVGTGVSWNAGAVLGGFPTNFTLFGVETDQTINETPSTAMLRSTRIGIAALLKQMGRDANSAHFHKTIASPRGRKQDPWFDAGSFNEGNWPAELARERGNIQAIMGGGSPPGTDWWDTVDENRARELMELAVCNVLGRGGRINGLYYSDVLADTWTMVRNGIPSQIGALDSRLFNRAKGSQSIVDEVQFAARHNQQGARLSVVVDDSTGAWYAVGPGVFWHLPDMVYVGVARGTGLIDEDEHHVDSNGIKVVRDMALSGPAAIYVKPTPPTTHTVVAGDTLIKIAAAYGIPDWHSLITWNGLNAAGDIEIGQVLRLVP